MDHYSFAILILAIIFGLGGVRKVLSIWTQHIQEMTRLRVEVKQNTGSVDQYVIAELRREIMLLRDTTTQYDMSVERALTEMKSRLAIVESTIGIQNGVRPMAQSIDSEEPQTVQIRPGS